MKECEDGDHHLLTSTETGHGVFEQSYCNYQIMFKKQVYQKTSMGSKYTQALLSLIH
jgi:hypothetical protein